MTRVSPEVYVADAPIVRVGKDDVQFFMDQASATERKRIRLCAHRSTDDRMHEMFIGFTNGTFLQPSLHLKDESLHVIRGLGSYLFFDNHGAVTDVIPLGEYSSGRRFYCRIPRNVYHALVVQSEVLLIHEVTGGPFRREDTVFAPWAPSDADPAVGRYAAWLKSVADNPDTAAKSHPPA